MPGFFGFGIGNSPYWGNIGRDANWPPNGFPRFSISTQNVGVVVIAFALLAILTIRKDDKEVRNIIYFWTVVAIVSLMFAWGRYFDIAPVSGKGLGPYTIFFNIPQMDAMRNPLKFLYPFMLAVSILAAYGVEILTKYQPAVSSDKKGKKHK